MEPVPLSKLAMQSKSAQTSGAGSVMRPPRRRSCSRTVGRRFAQRRCHRGSGRARRRRRPLRRRGHRGRGGRSGRCWPRRRRWGRGCRGDGGRSRRCGRGGARGGCRQRSRVGGRSRWPGDQPHQDEQRHQCHQSRHRGDDLLPALPGAARAGLRRRWRAPLRRRSWRLVLPGVPAVRVHPSVGHGSLPSTRSGRARYYGRLGQSDRYARALGRGGSVVTSGGLVILLVIPPAVTPQVRTLLAGRTHRRDQQEPHSHARAGPRLHDL
jgi:hypothetical protein